MPNKRKKENAFTKQHIVPRAYINNFADRGTGKDKYLIGVVQKNRKHYIQSTNNIGYIENYYDVACSDDTKKWEHFFDQEIERPCLKTIKNIIARVFMSNFRDIVLTDAERMSLSRFIIAQFLRVPDFIDYQINNAQNNIFPKYISEFLLIYNEVLTEQQKNVVKNIRFTNDQIKDFILSYVNDPQKAAQYCEILMSKPWVLYINKCCDSIPFITSDNPVIMTNLHTKSFSRSDNGLGNQNTVIFFPINPYIAIGIYPHSFSSSLKKVNCREVILSEKDISFITTMNKCEINQCYNQFFMPVYFYNIVYETNK